MNDRKDVRREFERVREQHLWEKEVKNLGSLEAQREAWRMICACREQCGVEQERLAERHEAEREEAVQRLYREKRAKQGPERRFDPPGVTRKESALWQAAQREYDAILQGEREAIDRESQARIERGLRKLAREGRDDGGYER